MFLNNITFQKDYRCYKKDEKLDFTQQVTIVTGDNGSGKSTLTACIRSCFNTPWTTSDDPNAKGMILTDVEDSKNQEIAYLCFSSDLLANSPHFGDDLSLHIKTMSMSSGQGSLEQLIDMVEKSKHLPLLILDEPEKGLCRKRVNLIFKYLLMHTMKNPKQQIIIVTHSEILMRLSSEVFSTSHKKYISDTEYLDWMDNHKSVSPFSDEIVI